MFCLAPCGEDLPLPPLRDKTVFNLLDVEGSGEVSCAELQSLRVLFNLIKEPLIERSTLMITSSYGDEVYRVYWIGNRPARLIIGQKKYNSM